MDSASDYDPSAYPPFAVTADVVVLAIHDQLEVLLIERGSLPFAGRLALPGGFVEPDESLDQAAIRELGEETGLGQAEISSLEQLAAFGEPDRDPRMRVVSIAYLALAPVRSDPVAGSDAAAVQWFPVDEATTIGLAFDHGRILETAVDRLRAKLEQTTVATVLAGEEFTMEELRHIYEAAWGRDLDPVGFAEKVSASPGFVVDTGSQRNGLPLYRPGAAQRIDPPLLPGR